MLSSSASHEEAERFVLSVEEAHVVNKAAANQGTFTFYLSSPIDVGKVTTADCFLLVTTVSNCRGQQLVAPIRNIIHHHYHEDFPP
jgi:hypothetical protein